MGPVAIIFLAVFRSFSFLSRIAAYSYVAEVCAFYLATFLIDYGYFQYYFEPMFSNFHPLSSCPSFVYARSCFVLFGIVGILCDVTCVDGKTIGNHLVVLSIVLCVRGSVNYLFEAGTVSSVIRGHWHCILVANLLSPSDFVTFCFESVYSYYLRSLVGVTSLLSAPRYVS